MPAWDALPKDHHPPGGISTRLVSLAADSADPAGINDYDSFAEAYTASNETNLLNAYYERPAMLALAGEVAGADSRRWLRRWSAVRGAARPGRHRDRHRQERRDGGAGPAAARWRRGPAGGRAGRTASLPRRHLRRRRRFPGPALPGGLGAPCQLRRVLKPGGRLIVSVDHPFAANLWHREAGDEPDYFATCNWVDEWTVDGQTALLRFWARPLHAMTDAFTAAGFGYRSSASQPPRRIPPRAARRRKRGRAALLVLPVLCPARQLTPISTQGDRR